MKYRKKPVVVEADLWEGPWVNHPAVVEETVSGDARTIQGATVVFYVQTAGGRAEVHPGDFLIQERDGRGWYPCRPDIFEATYEAV